jgi:hypothetical protein
MWYFIEKTGYIYADFILTFGATIIDGCGVVLQTFPVEKGHSHTWVWSEHSGSYSVNCEMAWALGPRAEIF